MNTTQRLKERARQLGVASASNGSKFEDNPYTGVLPVLEMEWAEGFTSIRVASTLFANMTAGILSGSSGQNIDGIAEDTLIEY
jgi:hypothetical protein